jgi:hypothetical protein
MIFWEKIKSRNRLSVRKKTVSKILIGTKADLTDDREV